MEDKNPFVLYSQYKVSWPSFGVRNVGRGSSQIDFALE